MTRADELPFVRQSDDRHPCARPQPRLPLLHLLQRPVRYRALPGQSTRRRRPVEILPAIVCSGSFRSHPINADLPAALYESRLTVRWRDER